MAKNRSRRTKTLSAKKAPEAAAQAAVSRHPLPFLAVPSLIGILFFFLLCLSTQHTIKLCALVCVIIMLVSGSIRFRVLRQRVWLPLLLLLLCVVMDGISTLYAISGKFALYEYLKVLIGLSTALSLLAVSPVKERVKGRAITCTLSASAALCSLVSIDLISTRLIGGALLGFLGLFTSDYANLVSIEAGVRMNSLFSNPNVFAGFTGLGTLLSLGLTHTAAPKSGERCFAAVLLFVTAFGFVLAFSMGASIFILLAFLVLLALERRESKGDLLVLMLETLVLCVVFAGVVSTTSFREWTGVQPIPLLCTAVGAAALAALDRTIGVTLGSALNSHPKRIPVTLAALLLLAALYITAALNWTGPAALYSGETLRRAAYPSPGTYHLRIDSDGPLSVTITSQNRQETMMHTSTTLANGDVDTGELSFTVPEDSLVTWFEFRSADGGTIRSAEFEGTRIPLGYRLLPGFIARRLQGLFANENAIQRTVFFEDGLKLFQMSPLFGRGMGGFENGIKSVQSFYYETKYAHNHYIQTLVETGVIGLILFVLLLAGSAACILKARFGRTAAAEEGLLSVLGAALVFMAGHATTEVVFSSCYYIPMAFGVLALINLCCGESLAPKWLSTNVKRIVLILTALLSVVYSILLGGNLYAARLFQEKPGFETAEEAVKLDRFEWMDYAFSYVVYATRYDSEISDDIRSRADAFAATLESVDSNTGSIYLAQYYFGAGKLDRAFRMLEKHLDYVSSDASAWQSAFSLLQAYESSDAQYVEGVRRIIEKMDEWNAGNMGEITLDEQSRAFVERMRQVP